MILGLTGYARSGKDTVGDYLVNVYAFRRLAFADALKDLARVIGWDGVKDDLPRCTECGMLRGRELLQVLGTEGVRDILGEDAWLHVVRRAVRQHELAVGSLCDWVITDVRFPNEARFVDEMGGQVWRLQRGEGANSHPSETEVDAIRPTLVLDNTGSLDDLYEAVDRAMGPL